ncbi:hypothetical protein ABEB36_003551 [Hypothenemus hampei]|uniref:T-box domain-containing protein n=1 Tax=Hypothenemus hampei TaxID=57062 RepID=A0ABD1FC70_HYPHA
MEDTRFSVGFDGLLCECKLLHMDLWKKFHENETEMVITKAGRVSQFLIANFNHDFYDQEIITLYFCYEAFLGYNL